MKFGEIGIGVANAQRRRGITQDTIMRFYISPERVRVDGRFELQINLLAPGRTRARHVIARDLRHTADGVLQKSYQTGSRAVAYAFSRRAFDTNSGYSKVANIKSITIGKYVRLSDIADVVEETVDLHTTFDPSDTLYLIEGQDIRAVEGVVALKDAERRWRVEHRKTSKAYGMRQRDVVIGLVRPERRNIGFFAHDGLTNVFASPDGVAVVREREDKKQEFPIEWIFQALRTERCRIQFWTESGGTSYGKLSLEQVKNVLVPLPKQEEIQEIALDVRRWSDSVTQASKRFHKIWDAHDKVVILNSPVTGLEGGSIGPADETEEEAVE